MENNKILEDIRELIKDNILPRLTQLEEEVRLLRKYTWPVCQSLSEQSALENIEDKREFIEQGTRDRGEAQLLLTRKWDLAERMVSRRPIFSSSVAKTEEWRRITEIACVQPASPSQPCHPPGPRMCWSEPSQ